MLHWCSTEMILRIQNSLVNIYIFQNESTIGERNKLTGLRAREQNKAFLPPANEILGKVMFLPMSLILFTRGDGVSQHAKRKTHLSAETPPQADTNLRRHPPRADTLLGRHHLCQILWDMVNKRAVHILLECNLLLGLFSSFKFTYFSHCFSSPIC